MKRKNKTIIVNLVLLVLLAAIGIGSVGAQSISYYINHWTYTANSGGVSNSASYVVRGTLGQPSVASSTVSNPGFTVTGGIWVGGTRTDPAPDAYTLRLPLVVRTFGEASPPLHEVEDAPDDCPGLTVQLDHHYGEDFDWTNDNDWWQLTAESGMTYTLHTLDLGSKADTVLALYADDCVTILGENDDAQEGVKASYLAWQAPASGVYHVMVHNFDGQNYGPNVSYTFIASRGRTPLPVASSAVISNSKPSLLPAPARDSN